MSALVRETIGFDRERGDSVNLMNAPFVAEAAAHAELPVWKRPEVFDLARSLAWPFGLALIGAMVLFGMVRPGLKAMAQSKPPASSGANQFSAMLAETPPRPALPSGAADGLPAPLSQAVPEQARLEGARQMARQNPVAVANIVKTWINGDAAAAS